jgi:hypothetical protein
MCEPSKNGSTSFKETADPSPKDHRRFNGSSKQMLLAAFVLFSGAIHYILFYYKGVHHPFRGHGLWFAAFLYALYMLSICFLYALYILCISFVYPFNEMEIL